VGEAAFLGLDDGAGVVRDQAAQQGFGVVDVAEVAGAVQAVRAAVVLPAAPGAAEVFGLDPDMIGVQLGADGEVLGPAPGVPDGVEQLGRDEHRVGGGRAPCQVPGYRTADVAHLVGSPRVCAGM
jgi:hypothetical protein